MLSENLHSLYRRLGAYTDSGLVLDPGGVEMVRAILKAAMEDAEELESRTVPFADQVTELPDNVVQYSFRSIREGYVMSLPLEWVTTFSFASLTKVTWQGACNILRRAHDGHCWRGHRLIVRRVFSQGGQSGWRYEVRLDSLPEEYQRQYLDNLVIQEPAKTQPIKIDDYCEAAQWRYEVIQLALKHPSRSPERAKEIALASRMVRTWPTGKKAPVSIRTIREWLKLYEQSGMAGLKFGKRADKGKLRVSITRKWDNAVPFDDATKEQISEALLKDVKSLWATTTEVGWPWITRLARDTLERYIIKAGFKPDDKTLRSICTLTPNFVKRGQSYRDLAIYDKDRKRWFDNSMPPILRTRENRQPMDIVISDVHHLDILLRRDDGSVFTPKIIAWQDWATNRVFAYPVFLPKRRMVRQEDVIEAYIAMVTHPEWGVPKSLYLDNGGEYNFVRWMDDAHKLSGTSLFNIDDDALMVTALQNRRSSIIKARPYNAPAKAIEGLFGVLEGGVLSMLPGWIGGNRMKKKTANLGKEPETYNGSIDDFRQSLNLALNAYETHPQGGVLNGLSPRESFNQFVSDGWERMDIEADTLRHVFAKTKICTIKQGGFQYGSTPYTARAIQRLSAGTKVIVRVPLFEDKSRMAVLTMEEKFLCIAAIDTRYDGYDTLGAKESVARIREQKAGLAEMRRDVYSINMEKRLQSLVAKEQPALIPNSAGSIQLSDTMEHIAQEMAVTPAQCKQAESDDYQQYIKNYREQMENMKRVIGGHQ